MVKKRNVLNTAPDLEGITSKKHFFYENAFYLTSPPERLRKLIAHYELYKITKGVEGEIIECGVYKGASLSRFIKFRDIFGQTDIKKVVGFDVFGRFPVPKGKYSKNDILGRGKFIKDSGECGVSEKKLVEFLKESHVFKNVELVKGDVSITLRKYVRERPDLKISLLHIDIDLYRATLDCLKFLYEKVTRGGAIILDDYKSFPGATQAIDEFFSDKNNLSIERFERAPSPHYVIKK